MIRLGACLAIPTRLRIVEALVERERPVSELVDVTGTATIWQAIVGWDRTGSEVDVERSESIEPRDPSVTLDARQDPSDPGAVGLNDAEAHVRRAAFRSVLSGRAADAEDLARATGLAVDTVAHAVDSLVRNGQAIVDHTARIVATGGLSLVPAGHRLRLGDDEFHTWCAIDAIGIPAALGADAVAGTTCPACGRPIEVRFREGRGTHGSRLRVWLPRQECWTSLVDEMCPQMNLFCSQEHLDQWRRREGEPPGAALTLGETEALGRMWWGDLR